MYKIISKEVLNQAVEMMVIHAPYVARKCEAGQFIIVRVDEEGERVPLTIADYDREAETVTIIYQVVGYSTQKLSEMKAGDCVADFVGPLVQPPPLHKVDHVVGVATDDGSLGTKGFVTNVLSDLIENGDKIDEVIAIGPLIMMKNVVKVTQPLNIPTAVSLNPIMIDGTGMCGGCRVSVGGKTKFACVDGPDFNGFEVDFDECMKRQTMFKEEEHQCKIGRGV